MRETPNEKYIYESVTVRKRNHLPHWDVPDGLYSVSFRLFDSLPAAILDRLRQERQAIIAERRRKHERLSVSDMAVVEDYIRRRTEEELDRGAGSCMLAEPRIASMLSDALRFFDRDRYRLFTFSVMPNHVHSAFRLAPGWKLDKVLHSWKSYTSKEANKILQRSGTFWQEEYFDELIRDRPQLQQTIEYIVSNPARAGLRDWPWVERFEIEDVLRWV